jgi:hypothetical protein
VFVAKLAQGGKAPHHKKKGGNAPSGHNTDNSAQLTTILSDAGGSNSKIYTHCTTTFF